VKRSIISTLAIATAFALSACGTGMNSQTAEMVAPVAGISLDTPVKDGEGNPLGTLQVRNAALVYPGPQGYKSGTEATARAWVFNMTPNEQAVAIKYQGQEIKRVTIKSGGYERVEMKLKLAQDVSNAQWVPVTFDWVGVTPAEAQLPIAPPEAPQPGEKVELPAEPGAEGH
jgi:hypothetical protein